MSVNDKSEKAGLLPSATQPQRKKPWTIPRWLYIAWFCFCAVHFAGRLNPSLFESGTDASSEELCPQVPPLIPEQNLGLWQELQGTYGSEAFQTRAVDWLSGAVKVPTESHDKMLPVGEDPRWEAFGPFHDYLLAAFPNIHATLEVTKINTYGLVYFWKGTDESLKPLLLAAHQDVVPVNPDTVDEWEHPPYSGYFDGKSIWGRGSSDDKSGLISIMSTVESLLERGFKPTRSVVLAYGFDEETSGLHGAARIGNYLLSEYGENSFALLVDEGGGFGEQFGGVIASPAIGEKGYIDTRVEVSTPGGHSSVPPPHTSIGILAALLVQYEANPFEPVLGRGTPPYLLAQCLAAHAPDLPKSTRKAIKDSVKSDKALRKAQAALFKTPGFEALVGTTQAIDLIQGGVKTNALPEQAWAVVNHRIATDSSVDAVKEHDTNILKSLASQFNLSYTAFGSSISQKDQPAYGTLTLTDAWGTALEPAPLTPTDAAPYALLSGTIKATYNSHRSIKGNNILVAPSIMTGNTDTRYYWALTEHIFRYNHHNSGGEKNLGGGVHTVNEHISVDSYIEMIRFFTTLILNTDESTVL